MIGSVGSIGSTSGQGLERAARRASGRYVEATEGASAGGDRRQELAIVDLPADAWKETYRHPTAISLGNPASAPFVAQLAALGLGDSATGERRVRRDPSLIVARADALYRDGYRRVTDLEPGFFGAAEY
ncbi:hypothetical protein CXZ10_16690 [Pleomorphomonas diazotrophica]|uniref:Uncharacterized protein n=1 Tax=Pleomorphomonas diazotrophica TaxID=1166257 RepID=A0A1I4RS42_9HYPH|nr:hypothetical protein [Pleomorphomonas diazotrophica]PKR88090.1 hypothetical protein CXZ10_16690 [Pleomorphomonas diazotrophica]SFM54989.1 hypothetical protein SAMN05192571_102205 [Pleomorphomonas diazotrophica]